MNRSRRRQEAEPGEGNESAALPRRLPAGGSGEAIGAVRRQRLTLGVVFVSLLARSVFGAQDIEEIIVQQQPGELVTKEGRVAFQPPQKPEVAAQVPQTLDFGDALRTHAAARATVRFLDQSRIRMRELTRLQVVPRADLTNAPGLRLYEGQIYVTSRGTGPRAIPIETPQARGVPRGTEYLVAVDPQSATTELTMFEGEVELTDGRTKAAVRSGQQAIVVAGEGIEVRPILQARGTVQWWIYYPGVLEVEDLDLTPAERARIEGSLEAYRQGDILQALETYPGYPVPPEPTSDAQRVYLAGLHLAVGAVDRATALLSNTAPRCPPAVALRIMIWAAGYGAGLPGASDAAPEPVGPESGWTASEWLAVSYVGQSTNNLAAALKAARRAVERAPGFGFAWARVAELEFSFARTRAARQAVEGALALSPRNAQALALRGFILAADSRVKEAIAVFDEAIRLDPALGKAWLGRGLCKRKASWSAFRGPVETRNSKLGTPPWLADLQTAAILEPSRSLFRSYLGKAFGDAGDPRLARRELDLAKALDPNDPTPWLYSALLDREEDRINEAVRDLERSIDLNDNRALYRSRLLLDQDRAVRSSSLANLYQSAGMDDVSVREAARAVSDDFANYSAHQFLSESFGALRDPTRFNLRYETPWFSERLLANLLSPVGGTPLSPYVSQEEYARLFEQNRIGLSSETSYRSDGQVWELASQYGTVGNTAWSLDLDYQHNDGVRPNNELDRLEWYTTFKQQLTPQDSILLLAEYQDYHSGDNFQYFDPTNARPHYTFDEDQKPILAGAYHHEWAPGVHTMLLGGWLQNEQAVSDRAVPVYLFATQGTNVYVPGAPLYDVAYRNDFEAYTVELTQVLQDEHNTLLVGGRYQGGSVETWNNYAPQGPLDPLLPGATGTVDEDFERVSAYGYYTLKVVEPLLLTAGLSYDRVTYPSTFRNPPVTAGTTTADLLGPKAALVWSPRKEITLRGVYTRSLGGVTLDQSYRLEPTQLAGFVQTYRSIISESLVGSVSAPEFETAGAALDLKFATRTYAGLQFENLRSEVRRDIGVFAVDASTLPPPPAVASSTPENLDYTERSVAATLNQLLSDEWAVGAQYRFTRSELHSTLPAVPVTSLSAADQTGSSDLQEISLYGLFNHRCGFFARLGLDWFIQDNRQETYVGGVPVESDLPGDEFPQLNLFVGYRFPKQRGDITLGGLNLTGEDYHLNPLTPYMELPRERVFYARLRFRF